MVVKGHTKLEGHAIRLNLIAEPSKIINYPLVYNAPQHTVIWNQVPIGLQ